MAVVGSYRAFVGLEAKRRHTFHIRIRVEARIWYINVDLACDRKRNSGKPIGARTSSNNHVEREHNDQWTKKRAENVKPASPDPGMNFPPWMVV
jgi:hypothetical protein